MWLAYHMRVAVPAYSSVSCREKPTFSLASTNRRLAKVGALTSRSVPVMSLSERTIMDDLPSDQDRVDRRGEDPQALAGPKVHRRRGGDERRVRAAEGAVVLARLPDVQLGLEQRHGERQAVAAQRLGQADDVRDDPGILEAEEGPGASAAHLHVV